MKYKKIYDIAPVFVQNIMTSVYGKILMDKRYGKKYREHMKFLRSNFTQIDHSRYQLEALNTFLQYVYNNSNYYRKVINQELLPLKSIADLDKLPILTKELIRSKIDEIVTAPKNTLSPSFTGGTTGKSLNIFYDFEDFEKRVAFLDFFKERHGVLHEMKRASFTGKNLIPVKQKKKVFWRYNYPLKQLLFSSFHLTEENIPHYIKALNKFKPQSLDGFPSVMVTLAKYIVRNNIKLSFKLIAIFPTAETVSDNDREIIEMAFKAKMRNQYASSEGAPFITECLEGNLHLDIMTGVFEKVDKDKDVSEVYVTAFETKGTPLVRYKIGDVLEFTNRKCTCGYNAPLVNRIIGRSMDFLYSKERGKISNANMSNTIKNLPNSIINIQFVQEVEDEIEILIVKDKTVYKSSHERDLLDEMKIRLGESIKFSIQYVNEISVENSGKYRMVKNNMGNLEKI
ncbi:phenylacetate--CoA ligase family protein [Sporosarcina sp. SG10008]|uniref:phenylacetate--CoA ligase family protein n=1 Tax=Sporosarcina sp. SG10008 TaxID=3373103 RepID=UPI0037DD8A6A